MACLDEGLPYKRTFCLVRPTSSKPLQNFPGQRRARHRNVQSSLLRYRLVASIIIVISAVGEKPVEYHADEREYEDYKTPEQLRAWRPVRFQNFHYNRWVVVSSR